MKELFLTALGLVATGLFLYWIISKIKEFIQKIKGE